MRKSILQFMNIVVKVFSKPITLLHENFAAFLVKIAFRVILISRFRQKYKNWCILISRSKSKIKTEITCLFQNGVIFTRF